MLKSFRRPRYTRTRRVIRACHCGTRKPRGRAPAAAKRGSPAVFDAHQFPVPGGAYDDDIRRQSIDVVTKQSSLLWKLGIAAFSLFAAIAIYVFARAHPPAFLDPLRFTNTGLAARGEVFASMPSLFYTLAVGLLIGICTSTRSAAVKHCLAWLGLALGLELSQHSLIARPLSSLLYEISPGWFWHLIGPYWTRGVFDPLDLLATLIGGGIALLLSGHLCNEYNDSTFC